MFAARFITDFVAFIEAADARSSGFTERVLDLRATSWGDMAHVRVPFGD